MQKITHIFSLLLLSALMTQAQQNSKTIPMNNAKMKIEIWSDVMCPFCYIGKEKFEKALNSFTQKNNIEVEWKSFQLDPSITAADNKDYQLFLQNKKGLSSAQVKQMLANVTDMAGSVGLDFHFEKAIVANSFDAHRLIHLTKTKGLQNKTKELLLKAHFVEGKNIGDKQTLIAIAEAAGINKMDAEQTLNSTAFAEEVKKDINEAEQIGVRGVPFFVFNRKYAVSGAQDTDVFLQTIEKSFTEWQSANAPTKLEVTDGKICTPDKECK